MPNNHYSAVVELARLSYSRVQPLFDALAFHLSIDGVLAGFMPGRVLVDDEQAPRTALISSPEGNYLASAEPLQDSDVPRAQALVEHLHRDGPVELYVAPAWEQQADALVAGFRPRRVPRRRYALATLAGNWYEHVSAPFTLARLDAVTMARPGLAGHHIEHWASGNWGSVDAFTAHGFGAALFHDELPVSWCLADSAVGSRCEIGIHTHPAFRRQGLATIVVSATVAEALAHGYTEIGWHCDEANIGSQQVAEKIGFRLTHHFNGLVYEREGND
jgi:GNAT superfamily N-acetyltransferase